MRGKKEPAREENVPALQDQASPDARLFCENVVSLRQEGFEPAAQEGPQAPDRLRGGVSHPAAPRMTPSPMGRLRHKDFVRVCSNPPVDRTRCYRLYAGAIPVGLGGRARLGTSVSRRVGKAVIRNRVRRRLKAAFRANVGLAAGTDVVIVAGPGIDRLPFGVLCELLERSLKRAPKYSHGGEAPKENQNASDKDSPGDTGVALPDPVVSSPSANV